MTEYGKKYSVFGNRILFLGCHLDDIELGCGGILHQLKKVSEIDVRAVTLSKHNENAKRETFIQRDLTETKRAMGRLGHKDSYEIADFTGQFFDCQRQEIRDYLGSIKRSFDPTAIFYPARGDIHQDHETLSDEAFRLFRDRNCYGYEIIRSNFLFTPNLYISLEEEDLDAKVDAIGEYKTQLVQSAGYYFHEDVIRSIAKFRGTQAAISYAEGFEAYITIL